MVFAMLTFALSFGGGVVILLLNCKSVNSNDYSNEKAYDAHNYLRSSKNVENHKGKVAHSSPLETNYNI